MKTLNTKTITILAACGLVLTTIIWGSGFVVMKNSIDYMPPLYTLAIRFTFASIGLAVLLHKKLLHITKEELINGFILGVLLFLAYFFQTYGLKYTTASNNAFITTLYVVFVPFLQWLIYKKRPKVSCLFAAFLAMIGIALLSLNGNLSMNIGDFLTLLCGVCFAIHMLLIEDNTKKFNPILLTFLQIIVTAILCWIFAPLFDGSFPAHAVTPTIIINLLYLGLASTMLCFMLQNIGQKYVPATTVAIILSLESVFGVLFSVIFLHEILSRRMIFGCILIFIAILISELSPKWKKR